MELGRTLRACGYRFITPTPETHRRVNQREANRQGRSLADVFGWSRPFGEAAVPPALLRLLADADALDSSGPLLRSTMRFSSLGDLLLVHSAFPTEAGDAVFFGPDTYRFARTIEAELRLNGAVPPSTIIDIGAGSGAGAFVAASLVSPARIILTDVNAKALRLAQVNAALNEVPGVEFRNSDVLAGVAERADLILCNPPYLVDAAERVYRHGGGPWGFDLSLRIVREGLEHLAPRGKLILYTGTPIVGGIDLFFAAVRPLLADRAFRYAEVDPDVFAEELARPPYDTADRIAVVLLVVEASKQGMTMPLDHADRRDLSSAMSPGALRELSRFNKLRLTPGLGEPLSMEPAGVAGALRFEAELVETVRGEIAPLVERVPAEADAFVGWFEDLRDTGPGQGDRLFPWLATTASREQMRWFLHQEVAGEAGFDDLLAMTQVKMPVQAKLEMARNYWDEMGRGAAKGMHGPMLDRLAQHFDVAPVAETTVPQSLTLGNVMIALATSRRYAFHSVGALGVIELTAPGRAAFVTQGLRRLGVPAKQSHYFALHAVLDVKHSEAWNREILRTLVAEDARRARPIAEGAVMRLWCGARCFDRYRREFGLEGAGITAESGWAA